MQITLNGTREELAQPVTLLGLLESKALSPQAVVVELNGEIVPGADFATVALNDGDHLEVLRFVGGG